MQVFNGVNSKNVGTLSKLVNSADTMLINYIPEVKDTLINDVDNFVFCIRRGIFKDAINIMQKHGVKITEFKCEQIKFLLSIVKKRSIHIKVIGYIFDLRDIEKNIVVQVSDGDNTDELFLFATIADTVLGKVSLFSSIDLNETTLEQMCERIERFNHIELIAQKYINSTQNKRKNFKNSDVSSWIEEQTTKKSEESKNTKSQESWINRVSNQEKDILAVNIPDIPELKLCELELEDYTSYTDVDEQYKYFKIHVGNNNLDSDKNKILYYKIGSHTKGDFARVITNTNNISSSIDTTAEEYRSLMDEAYAFIKYWRKGYLSSIGNNNYNKFIYSVASEYSRLIENESFRHNFVYAVYNLYIQGIFKISNGLVSHDVMLSSIYRLNNHLDCSTFEELFRYDFIFTTSDKELRTDTLIYLYTLALDPKYTIFEFTDVSFLPTSLKEIEDRACSEQSLEKNKVSTIAHEASKEMDELLFNGDTPGLYRDNQFKRNITIVMNTIFEELISLWQCQNMIRPGFETGDNLVKIPTIFANIKGVGRLSNFEYSEYINNLLNSKDHTTFIHNNHISYLNNLSPFEIIDNNNIFKYSGLFLKGELNKDRVKALWNDNYRRLSVEKQTLILSKVEEACRYIGKLSDATYEEIIFNALNIPEELLRGITWFDFTKDSPKLVMLFDGNDTLNRNDCITLFILNLIGFDIAVFTPTNYKGIEAVLNAELFCEYFIGEPKFDIHFTRRETQKKGFFASLFGK